MLDISVIIGFKDWGVDRLDITLSQLVPQTQAQNGEVIVVDYGSADPIAVADIVEASGARIVRVETDGTWSRARALNAGVEASSGKVIVTTDADMLFTPQAIAGIKKRILADPQRASILQCKDLPERLGAEHFSSKVIDWDECESSAVFRPRYGMGGMIACSREAFLHIRGFDERMHTYGGEDMDFAERLRKTGHRFDWITDPEISIYHIWHSSSRAASQASTEGAAAIAMNAHILQNDESVVRNLTSWRHRPHDAKPATTVVIVTRNRLDYLKESIASVYLQTVQDFQLIVVDDGSDDGTWEFLSQIDEPRFKALRQERAGIAAARNMAAQHVKSDWVVIHDDDDIMLPNRIEKHFESLSAGIDGTYGGWVDFDDFVGGTFKINTGRDFTADAPRFAGGIFVHGTLMLRASLLEAVPYDETFRSGSDYNLALRLIRSGLKLKHFGGIAILRRLHPRQVTHHDASYQRASWSISKQFAHPGASAPQIKFKRKHVDESIKPGVATDDQAREMLRLYGPQSWAKRSLLFRGDGQIPADLSSPADWYRVHTSSSLLGESENQVQGVLNSGELTDGLNLALAGFIVEYAAETNQVFDPQFTAVATMVGSALGALNEDRRWLIGNGEPPEDVEYHLVTIESSQGSKQSFVADFSDIPASLALEFAAEYEGNNIIFTNGSMK